METGTLTALARAAHVSFTWLATGKGGPDDELVPDEDDRYPNRGKAATYARAIGELREEAIRQVLDRQYQLDGDLSVHDWLEEMTRENKLLGRGVGAPLTSSTKRSRRS